jgi:hypothetical protein
METMNARNLIGTVICAVLVWATTSAAARGRDAPVDYRLVTSNGEDPPRSFSQTVADQPQGDGCFDGDGCPPCCCPRWTASADCLILDRIGGANQTLVERVPLFVPPSTPGNEALNGNGMPQGFCAGPRLDLIRHGDCGYDLEFSYFQIDGWSNDTTVEPYNHWLVMRAPGFLQTNQGFTQAMVWDYATRLYNVELNARWHLDCPVTLLAGFRWVSLRENLVGALQPPTFSWEPPFWNGTTINNLYGFQIGADGKLLDLGRFSIGGLVKAGIYDDNAEATTAVSVIHKQVRTATDSTNQAAFVGETGLQCKYQLTQGLALRAGYEVIWLQGVALAPGQVQETLVTTSPKSVQALGVNCNSGVFCHGATVGLEYSF